MIEKLYNLKGSGPDMEHLLSKLNEPHHKLKVILVGGTNGKGSTCAFISHILHEAGYRVGLFTSPHLIRPEERLRINQKMISPQEMCTQFELVWDALVELYGSDAQSKARFFHCLTAMALNYFYEKAVDVAVLEVGVGGRRDATAVAKPLISVITNVELDHIEKLGSTIEKIAYEKAGIVPPDGILITAEEKERALGILAQECRSKRAKCVRVPTDEIELIGSDLGGQIFSWRDRDDLKISLLGAFQLMNAVTALEAVDALKPLGFSVSERALREGLRKTRWPGRLEVIQREPLIILDGAKNPAGMRALKESLLVGKFASYKGLILILGISTRKDMAGMIKEIVPMADVVIITQAQYRGEDPRTIAREVQRYTQRYQVVSSVREAIERALEIADRHDLILVTGSLFLVGEAKETFARGQLGTFTRKKTSRANVQT